MTRTLKDWRDGIRAWATADPAHTRTLLDRLSDLPPAVPLACSLLLFLILSIPALVEETPIFDEGTHLAAGYSYAAFHDFRLNPEHPPLGKLLSALPLLALDVRWPTSPEAWNQAQQYWYGFALYYQCGNDPDSLVFWSRLPTLIWGMLLLSSVYLVSRLLFGSRGGLISLVVATFCPSVLAHSHYVTTDLIVATLSFMAVVALWRALSGESLRWTAYAGVLLGGALGSKFTAVLLGPIVLLVAASCYFQEPEEGSPSKSGVARLGELTGKLLLAGLIAFVTLWGIYDFRFSADPDGQYAFSWDYKVLESGATAAGVKFAREHHLLPEAYLKGFADVQQHSLTGHGAYALGLHSSVGWWWYFPFAFLVKTPLPTLLLMVAGLFAARKRSSPDRPAGEFLFIPLIIFWVLSISSNINIGIRHLLPVYPPMLVLAGGVAAFRSWETLLWVRRGAFVLICASALSCLAEAPYYLAYFNFPSRLFFERHEMLADSNLDWGQDLARLKKYMERHGIDEIKLAYFGLASPRRLQLKNSILPAGNSYQSQEKEWKKADPLVAGDWVAVSLSNYIGIGGFDDKDYYVKLLGKLRPVTTIGHSIAIYRIPEKMP